jgi:hypothetical protein
LNQIGNWELGVGNWELGVGDWGRVRPQVLELNSPT